MSGTKLLTTNRGFRGLALSIKPISLIALGIFGNVFSDINFLRPG